MPTQCSTELDAQMKAVHAFSKEMAVKYRQIERDAEGWTGAVWLISEQIRKGGVDNADRVEPWLTLLRYKRRDVIVMQSWNKSGGGGMNPRRFQADRPLPEGHDAEYVVHTRHEDLDVALKILDLTRAGEHELFEHVRGVPTRLQAEQQGVSQTAVRARLGTRIRDARRIASAMHAN